MNSTTSKVLAVLAVLVAALGVSPPASGELILGTGAGSLANGQNIGGRVFVDLTDPEENGRVDAFFLNGFVTASFNEGPLTPTENAHNVFFNNVGGGGNKWCCNGPEQWVTFQFSGGSQFPIDAYTLTSGNDVPDRDPIDWVLEGSNDGATFTPIHAVDRTSAPFTDRNQVVLFDSSDFTNFAPYEYVRFRVTDTVNGFQLNEIELFADGFTGGPDVEPPPTDGTPVGTGAGALLNGRNFGGRDFVDLTDPEGDATGTGQFLNGFVTASFNVGPNPVPGPTENAHNLFENNVGGGDNKLCCSGPEQWVTFQFSDGNQFPIDAYTLTSGNDVPNRDPIDWVLEGSNDGTNFVPIHTVDGEVAPFSERNQVVLFDDNDFTNASAYEYVRFRVTDTISGFQLNEIELFAGGFTGGPNILPQLPGRIVGGLIGDDLTDRGDDGDEGAYNPPADLGGFDAVFSSTDEPGFGGGEFSFNVFDNQVGGGNDKWCCNDPGTNGHQLDAEIQAGRHVLTQFTLTSSNDSPGRDPNIFSIEGSNDGVNFTEIFSYDGTEGPLWDARNQTRLFEAGVDFEAPRPYSIFRYNVQDTVGGDHALNEIEYFGDPGPFRIEVAGDDNVGAEELATLLENVVGGARFVRVLERPGTDSRFHISEIEAFETGVAPDEAGPSNTVNGPNLSTNDIPAVGFDAATTTSSLEHGNPNGVFDGDHESAGAVWSAANGQSPPEPRYTLDLGSTFGLETVRVFPRNDTCCQDRFANLTVELYADDGGGNPGTLVDSANGPDNAPGGTNQALELTLNAPLLSGDVLATLYDEDTYVFEIQDGTTADQLVVPNPQPGLFTSTLDVANSSLEVELLGGAALQDGDTWTLLVADQFVGNFEDIILPTLPGGLQFDTSQLLVDGTLSVTGGAAAIPEPSTFALAGLALLGLACFGRRARRR